MQLTRRGGTTGMETAEGSYPIATKIDEDDEGVDHIVVHQKYNIILGTFWNFVLLWKFKIVLFTDGDDNGEDIVNEWNAENVDINQNIVILH